MGEGKEKAERTKNIEPRNCHIANIFRPGKDLRDHNSEIYIKLPYEKMFHDFKKSIGRIKQRTAK